MIARNYIRDSRGRFAATPGKRVLSALDEAEAALRRAEDGVTEIAAARRTARAQRKRTVRRAALAGAAVGFLAPAPRAVPHTIPASAAYVAATTVSGYKMGRSLGTMKTRYRSPAGTRLKR